MATAATMPCTSLPSKVDRAAVPLPPSCFGMRLNPVDSDSAFNRSAGVTVISESVPGGATRGSDTHAARHCRPWRIGRRQVPPHLFPRH